MSRGYALGALTTSEQISLESRTARLHGVLDQVHQRISVARSQGLDIGTLPDAYDELRSSVNRLIERVTVLDTSSDVEEWETELIRLTGAVDQLNAAVQAQASSLAMSGKVQIGLWTGAAVLGAIGLVLGVRWYAKRQRR